MSFLPNVPRSLLQCFHSSGAEMTWDAHEDSLPPSSKVLAGYLAQIGFDALSPRSRARGPPPVEVLRCLHRLHMQRVPFTNSRLPSDEQAVSLDPSVLYKQILVRRKGGFSYESNALFGWVLEQYLGCQVDRLEAWSYHPEARKKGKTSDHVCLLVHVNGLAWLADVTGCCGTDGTWCCGGFAEPLLFEPNIEQIQDSGRFRLVARGQSEDGTDEEEEGEGEEEQEGDRSGRGNEGTSQRRRSSSSTSTATPTEFVVQRWSSTGVVPSQQSRASSSSISSSLNSSTGSRGGGGRVEDAGEWVPLYRFWTWPRRIDELQEIFRQHLAQVNSHLFARRVVSRARSEMEGGGRVLLYDGEVCIVTDDGRLLERRPLADVVEYREILAKLFLMRLADNRRAMTPEPREPPASSNGVHHHVV